MRKGEEKGEEKAVKSLKSVNCGLPKGALLFSSSSSDDLREEQNYTSFSTGGEYESVRRQRERELNGKHGGLRDS